MEQMCQFVYDFYAHRVAAMVEMNQPKQLQKTELKISEPDGKTGTHPEDERDSDDEMDGKAVMNEIVNEVVDEWKQFLNSVQTKVLFS